MSSVQDAIYINSESEEDPISISSDSDEDEPPGRQMSVPPVYDRAVARRRSSLPDYQNLDASPPNYENETWFGRNSIQFWVAFFMLYISLSFIAEEFYIHLTLPPRETIIADGMMWPTIALDFDPLPVMTEYRRMQQSGHFAPANALILRIDNPSVCITGPLIWRRGGSSEILKKDLFRCLIDPFKNIFLVPTILYGDNNAHAQMAIFNKTARTMEIFDPLGVEDFGAYGNRQLTVMMTDVAADIGFERVVQYSVPVQLIEQVDFSIDVGAGLCQAYVYWYTNVLLLNIDVNPSIRNQKMARYLDQHGIQGVMGFIKTTIDRSKYLTPRPAFLLDQVSVSFPDPVTNHYYDTFIAFREYAANFFGNEDDDNGGDDGGAFLREYNRYWMTVIERFNNNQQR